MSAHTSTISHQNLHVLETFIRLQRAVGVRSVVWASGPIEGSCERLAGRLVESGIIGPEARRQAVDMLLNELTDIRAVAQQHDLVGVLAN